MVHIKTPLIFLRATSDPRWPYFLSARHFPCLRAGNSLLLGSGQVFPPITLNLQNWDFWNWCILGWEIDTNERVSKIMAPTVGTTYQLPHKVNREYCEKQTMQQTDTCFIVSQSKLSTWRSLGVICLLLPLWQHFLFKMFNFHVAACSCSSPDWGKECCRLEQGTNTVLHFEQAGEIRK